MDPMMVLDGRYDGGLKIYFACGAVFMQWTKTIKDHTLGFCIIRLFMVLCHYALSLPDEHILKFMIKISHSRYGLNFKHKY